MLSVLLGAVREVTRLKFAGTSICTGTRLLKMTLASDVPVNLRVLRYPCRVYYKGQPRPCAICRSPDHRAPDCPLRDVCRNCREPGHFARDCPRNVATDDDDDDDDDDVDDDDYVDAGDDDLSGDDDDESYDDDLGSGDEEVLHSASLPSSVPVAASQSSRPVCMDSSVSPYGRPLWIKRCPDKVRRLLSYHSSDAHIANEDAGFAVFDFGRLTYPFAFVENTITHPSNILMGFDITFLENT